MVVHVVEPDEVRSLQVVLDEANYAAAPLVPSVAMAGALAVIYLETMMPLLFPSPKREEVLSMNR
jgi:hypothetical protein